MRPSAGHAIERGGGGLTSDAECGFLSANEELLEKYPTVFPDIRLFLRAWHVMKSVTGEKRRYLVTCHSWLHQSPVSYYGGLGLTHGKVIWNMWRTKWRWNSFFSTLVLPPYSIRIWPTDPWSLMDLALIERVCTAVTPFTCIREVFGLNPGRATGYVGWGSPWKGFL
jgi:hypothetical protein